MNFFVPHVRDAAKAEEVWDATRCFLVEQGHLTTARRIRRLAFWNRAEHFDLEVGGHHPGMEDEEPVDGREENEAIRSTVFVILEGISGDWFYVCLPYRGVLRNYPWLVHRDEVTAVEDFEAGQPAPLGDRTACPGPDPGARDSLP